jgi:UDP-galactopyranose mutase
MTRILVVGAGFAGAVAARLAAEAGHMVQVIDRRPHIAGNAHDEVNEAGQRVHRYGPHLFHTNNRGVVDWLSRFTGWLPYEHRVTAQLGDGRHVPLPVNARTIRMLHPDATEAERILDRLSRPDLARAAGAGNAAAFLRERIGPVMTELLFGRYTRKMWGFGLEEMHASVVQRIPLRTDEEDRYFPGDAFQALPEHGYTAMFANILDHPRIRVALGTPFRRGMLDDYGFAFLCLPIDEFYRFALGELPYRSIRFHHRTLPRAEATAPTATVNFTDEEKLTRVTYWHRLPGHDVRGGPLVTATAEEPCDYRDNGMERYYPVRTADGRYQEVYRRYLDLARQERRLAFIGRCGTYQYLDMDQVVNQTIQVVRRWLGERTPSVSAA